MDDKERKLQELKRQNTERWQRLKLQVGETEVNTTNASQVNTTNASQEREEINLVSLPLKPNPRAFLRELVETHDELLETRAVLQQRLIHDKKKLENAKQMLQQTLERQRSMETKEVQKKSKPNLLSIREEQRYLERDLAYVTGLIDKTLSGNSGLWSLEEFLQTLLKRPSDDPFMLVSSLPIHPKHIELLRKCNIIQQHEDNGDLIRLTNYLE